MILKDWKAFEFGDIVQLSKRRFDPQKNDREEKCIELEHISQGTGQLIGYVNSRQQASIKTKFQKGDVLFGKLRPYLKKYLYCDFDGICSTEIWVFSAQKDKCDTIFLFYLIQTEKFLQVANVSYGSKMPRADWAYVSSSVFDLPPLAEQRKIAEILSTWDEAIAKTEALIAALEQRKKGLMQRLLTGQVRFPGFTDPWREVRLQKIAKITMGQSPSSSAYNNQGIGLPLIQGNADILNRKTNPKIHTSEITKECFENDIIVSVRAPVGEIALATVHGCIGRGVCAIQATNCDNSFLYQLLIYNEKLWLKYAQGSTFTAINSTDIRNMSFKIPKTSHEQEAIARILNYCDNEIILVKERLNKLKKQKKGLMQRLLTGEVRVQG